MDPSCQVEADGGREILRTRAGLGSGLELILPGQLWVNVPVTEAFAHASPYELRKADGRYAVYRDGQVLCPVRLAPRPAWYDRRAASGRLLRQIGTLQGTYLAIYAGRICDFWRPRTGQPHRMNCRFCSVGLNLGNDDAASKTEDDILEVVHAAWRESGVTYVDFNTGHDAGEAALDTLDPIIRRVKAETPLFAGVQAPPHRDLSRYDRLKAMGVNRISFCFELFDEKRFREVCPGKHAHYGLARYLEAIEYCAGLSKNHRFSLSPWVVNGEIIAGLEDPRSSMAAIDWMTARGTIPTVCVFRPLVGTDYAERPPPQTSDLVPVFRRLYEACMERGLPIGLAPHLRVSLVLLPEECRTLLDEPGRFRSGERRLRLQSRALGLAYRVRHAYYRARACVVPAARIPSPRQRRRNAAGLKFLFLWKGAKPR